MADIETNVEKKKGGANQVEATGALGRKDLLVFDPDDLIIDEDAESPVGDDRDPTTSRQLIESIKAFGVIKPPRVITRVSDDPKRTTREVVLLDGRRRVRAARIANQELRAAGQPPVQVACQVVKADALTLHGMTLAANTGYRPNTPLENARQLARHFLLGGDTETAAVAFGVTPATIYGWKKLMECSPKTQKAIDDEMIPVEAAKALSKLSPADQATAIDEMTKGGTVPVKGKKAKDAAVKASNGKGAAIDAGPKARSRALVKTALSQVDASLDNLNDYGNGFRDALRWALGLIEESELRTGTISVGESEDDDIDMSKVARVGEARAASKR